MVTIKKIAEIAGVSHATVSMVINNRKGPSQVLREKIKKIIEETGYVPNIGARNLVMKKGSNVGIFLLNFPEKKEDRLFYYYIELLEDIMLKMREKGYTLLFYTDRDRTRREISYADYCREQNLMSAIFLGMDYDDPNLEELKKLQSTQVIMFDLETGGEYNTIISDSSSGISEMMECLERNGKKRLAVVTGSMDSIISTQKKMDI
ncbi:MAG: LacI family DNA-binding transcriptional regulator, partial [Fusobacteriaceae bacterium]